MKTRIGVYISMILFLTLQLYSDSFGVKEKHSRGNLKPCRLTSYCNRSCSWTNIYLAIEGGLNWTNCDSVHGCSDHSDLGYCLGGLVGYQFPVGVALEFEVAFRDNSVEVIDYQGVTLFADHNIWSLSYLGNLVYELPYWCWKPFAGIGLGYANQHAKLTSFNLPTDENFNRFAYQIIAGFNYNIWHGLDLGIEYKFLHVVGSFIDNHALLLDMKWCF